MSVAFIFTFINIYFYQIGFSISQIGLLTALGPMISIAAQPLWGIISDKANKHIVLMIVLICAAIMSLIISLGTSFIFLIITLLLYWAFATSPLPLGDAITLEYIEGKPVKYSAIRVVGAISFGGISAAAGLLLDGDISRIFYYNALFLLLTALVVFFMPRDKNKVRIKPPKEKSGFSQIAELLKNKVIMYVYLSSFVYGLSMAFLFNFIGLRLTEIGAHEGQVGIAGFVAAFSEIPTFIIIERFVKRKPEYLLMFSSFFLSLRMFVLFIGDTIALIYFSQVLQGLSFIIHLYICIVLLHKHSPPHLKSTVQTIHAMIRMGIGALLGGLGGGILAQYIGIQNVFLILSIFVFTTCFVFPGVLIASHKIRNNNFRR
jgi:PPP family 3-phenylpropionic acid transporter